MKKPELNEKRATAVIEAYKKAYNVADKESGRGGKIIQDSEGENQSKRGSESDEIPETLSRSEKIEV